MPGPLREAFARWFESIADDGSLHPTQLTSDALVRTEGWSKIEAAIEHAGPPSRRPELYYTGEDGRSTFKAVAFLETSGLQNVLTAAALGLHIDIDTLADHLTASITDPPPAVEEWWLLDAGLPIGSTTSIADFKLEAQTHQQLVNLAPIPSEYALIPAYNRIDADVFQRSTFLHRVAPEHCPARGIRIPYLTGRPETQLWRPMLSLMLWNRNVVRIEACWLIERGRRVDRMYYDATIDTRAHGPDPADEYDAHQQGWYKIPKEYSLDQFQSFTGAIDRRVGAILNIGPEANSRTRKIRARRLQRSAEHILRASQRSYWAGEARYSDDRDEVLLHYVIAIEALLAKNETELSRRVSQRAAALFASDEERLYVAQTVHDCYNNRSSYAHGDDTGDFSLKQIREVALAIMLRWIILQADRTNGETVAIDLDHSLLSVASRTVKILEPINRFLQEYPAPLASLRHLK